MCLAATAAGSEAMADTASQALDPNAVQPLVVTGRPSIQALTATIQQTPQAINLVPKQVLEEQGVASLQDALRNVPGVTLNAGEGGSHGDAINLRGFPASDDFFLDGMRDTGFYTRDDFNLEAIEVYKGPASTLFGRGSTGGVVDQVSKAPRLSGFADGAITLGTNNEIRGVADVDIPISGDAALRIDAMGMRANVTDRDFVFNSRWGIAPTLKVGFGGRTSLTLSLFHQQEDDIPDYGVPFVAGRPAPVPRNTYYGLPTDDRFVTNVNIVTAKLNHEFSDQLSVSETLRYGNYWYDSRQTAPHYDPTGVVPPPTAATPLDQILIWRDRPSSAGVVTTELSQTEATWRVTSGATANTLVSGLDLDSEVASLTRYVNQISQIAPTPLLDPDPFEAFPGTQTAIRQEPRTATDTIGVFGLDTLDLGPHLSLIGGLRFDRFNAQFNEPITGTHFNHTDNIPSPRAALVYKPSDSASLYVSYGTSFDPSAENLSLSVSDQALPPERDKTYEAGAKFLLLHSALALSGSVFRTEMTNARIADPDNPSLQQLAGDLRVTGFELDASGHVGKHLELLANYTFLDGKNTTPTSAGLTINPLQNMAPNQANGWAVYEFDGGWKFGTGLNYLDRRVADLSGTTIVPAYLTWDAMLNYRFNAHLSAQLNAYNLTNALYYTASYFTSPTENHVIPGPGRTVTLTLAGRF
jgi:catecholate siderophore receptor